MVSLRETLEGAAFGTTDGIICSLGTIIGAAAATNSSSLAIIAGVLAGVSNSFANGVGMYVSQATERGLQWTAAFTFERPAHRRIAEALATVRGAASRG